MLPLYPKEAYLGVANSAPLITTTIKYVNIMVNIGKYSVC